MPSNILVKDGDQTIIQRNNEIYGKNRMALVSPVCQAYSGDDVNYSSGGIGNSDHKIITWDIIQQFSNGKFGDLIASSATELSQVNVKSSDFNYSRRAIGLEVQKSTLDTNVDMNNPGASIIQNLWKAYDFQTYIGGTGSTGIEGNSRLVTLTAQGGTTLSAIIAAVQVGLNNLLPLGWRHGDFSMIAIGITDDVVTKLSAVRDGSDKTDYQVLMEAYPGATWVNLPHYMQKTSMIEIALKPLVKHHHGADPSLWNSYTHPSGLGASDIYMYETAAVEIEEAGAVTRVPLTLS